MKTVDVRYGIIFGRGDSSDLMDWELELTDEEAKMYDDAIAKELRLNDIPELHGALRRAYKEIEEQQIWFGLTNNNSYVMECQGEVEMDTYNLNALVADRDPHAVDFFGLADATEDELAAWDANDLDEIPKKIDFIVDFEPYSPFDEGWTLNVRFVEPDEEDED